MIKITGLERYGSFGWAWTCTDPEGHSWESRTNRDGEGLWLIRHFKSDRQTKGTMQFKVSKFKGAAMKKLLWLYNN